MDQAETDPGGLPLAGRLRFLQGEPVTEPIPLAESLKHSPFRDPHAMETPERSESVRKALELAVRVGELLLRCGASTRDVETAVVAVAAAAGLRRVEVDITNQSLLMQALTPSGEPVTLMRVVRSNTRDFARLTAVHQLMQELVSGGVSDVDEATRKLRRIQRTSRLYPRWLIGVAYAGLAGSVCTLLGGGAMAVVVAVLSTLLVDWIGRWLSRRSIPSFYAAAVGACISVVIAWLGYLIAIHHFIGLDMPARDFGYAVAAGIVVLLPGRAMTSAVEDAVTGYPVTGAARLLTVVLSTAGIIVGVAAGLSLTLRLDKALDLELTTPKALSFGSNSTTASLLLVVACGAVGAVCSAVTMRDLPAQLAAVAVLGAVGLLLANLLPRSFDFGFFSYGGLGATTSIAIAAVAVGILGRLFAMRLDAPSLVLVVPATSPLLPGLRIFRGMYEAVAGSIVNTSAAVQAQAITTMMGAIAIALALSTGAVLGDVITAPLDRSVLRRRRSRRR